MLTGSCCCGEIRFRLSTPPEMMATCHCSRCRKVGASTFVFVKRDAFTLVAGADRMAVFEPESGYQYRRCFCSRCGSALGEIAGTSESFPIPANCFDDPLDIEVRCHEFVAEKPSWQPICDGAKQFERHPSKG